MKNQNFLKITFLIVGTLAALEFIFVQGMFTWLIAIAAVALVGVLNVVASLKHQDWLQAALYTLSTVALCMGYFAI